MNTLVCVASTPSVVLSTFPCPATQGWVAAHLPALSHTLLHGSHLLLLLLCSDAFLAPVFFWHGSPSPLWWGCVSEYTQGFHLPSLQRFL